MKLNINASSIRLLPLFIKVFTEEVLLVKWVQLIKLKVLEALSQEIPREDKMQEGRSAIIKIWMTLLSSIKLIQTKD